LFLEEDEVEALHDFEEECVEDYWRESKKAEKRTADTQLDRLNEKLDQMDLRMSEMHMHQSHIRGACYLLEEELINLSDNLRAGISSRGQETTEALRQQRETQQEAIDLNRRLNRVEKSLWSEYSEEKPLLTGAVLHLLKELQPKESAEKKDEEWSRDEWLKAVKKKLEAYRTATDSPPHTPANNARAGFYLPDPDASNLSVKPIRQLTFMKPNPLGLRSRMATVHSRFSEATRREYTTICDDIDLSVLNQQDSPDSSPFGSHVDLTQVGTTPAPKEEHGSNESANTSRRRSFGLLGLGKLSKTLPSMSDSKLTSNLNTSFPRSKSKDDEMIRAEVAERAELKGVLLKRLRQLSVATPETKTTSLKGDLSQPVIALSSEHEIDSAKRLSVHSQSEEITNTEDRESPLNKSDSYLATLTRVKSRSMSLEKPDMSPEEKRHKMSAMISAEEVGAFLNQRLTEEEENVVDPDLDLDLEQEQQEQEARLNFSRQFSDRKSPCWRHKARDSFVTGQQTSFFHSDSPEIAHRKSSDS
ncbi:Transient receptor putative cation channel subfamily M member 3, partial [Cichlidogyrus casuarinus]